MNWRVFKKAAIGVLKDALPVALAVIAALGIAVLGLAATTLINTWFGKWGVTAWLIGYVVFVFFSIAVAFRMKTEAQRERELAYEVAKRMEGKPMYYDEF